jgi:arginase family enzyme
MDLIAVPFNSSGRADGVARMPAALLDAGLARALSGSRVVQADVPPGEQRRGASGLLAESALPAMVGAVAERVLDAWAGDRVPVVIGGDWMAGALVSRHPHWWLHVDLDVLGSAALAAVDYPQPGGLSWQQLESLTESVLDLGGCGGLSVCIYNPDLDNGAAAGRISEYVVAAARRLKARSA